MQKSSLLMTTACLALGATLVFTGCATLLGGGTRQDVQISSTPAAAKVKVERSGVMGRVEAVWQGTTPATVNLKRKSEYLITVSLDGYQPIEVALEHGINGWVWTNILCLSVLGIIIDFVNGAAKKLVPDEVNVQLVTAMGPGIDPSVYAVFSALDSNGDLRRLPVPLIPDNNYVVTK